MYFIRLARVENETQVWVTKTCVGINTLKNGKNLRGHFALESFLSSYLCTYHDLFFDTILLCLARVVVFDVKIKILRKSKGGAVDHESRAADLVSSSFIWLVCF